MAYCVIVLSIPNESIQQINARVQADATLPREGVEDLQDILNAIKSGAIDATAQFTSRDTDPAVSTSGSGSIQRLYNLA
jgi:hypothetical protein